MAFWEVITVIAGYQQRVVVNWKQSRLVAYAIAAVHRNPKKSFPSIEKFMPLPGDEEAAKGRGRQRAEEYLATKEHYKKLGVLQWQQNKE